MRGSKRITVFAVQRPRVQFELELFVFLFGERAMAGSWGGDAPTPDLWASLRTVMNAPLADLEPFQRFEITELVELRRGFI